MRPLFGGIEAGGTKFVCAVGDSTGKIEKKAVIPTTTPDETLRKTIEFFRSTGSFGPLSAIGIATFGPVELDARSPHYGFITTPPKPGWGNCNIRGALAQAFKVPIGFDTDVNGAAIGEYRWGSARGLDTFVYVTVGTGIGAGGMVSRKLMHGLIHPEMGHMLLPQDPGDIFPGVCPFHGNCWEGLASGPAIEKRWDVAKAAELPEDHPAWELEARYLASAFANLVLVLSPQRIILGGGVAQTKHLYPRIREKLQKALNGYIRHPSILSAVDEFIVEPGLGDAAGLSGALTLAEQSFQEHTSLLQSQN